MEMNRNQWLMLGLVLLMMGIQLRLVDAFVLTPESTKFLRERVQKKKDSNAFNSTLLAAGIPEKHTIKPPRWVGWALVSAGGVLVLQSFAMRRPG